DGDRVVPHREPGDGVLLARVQLHVLLLLVALAGEAEEHQDDAEMDDVAAVAALLARDETDERGEVVGARGALAHARAADEFLQDRRAYERAQREADARRPDADAERKHGGAGDDQ